MVSVCAKYLYVFCYFKQMTAYELRISDWSSDVCSSDLRTVRALIKAGAAACHIEDQVGAKRCGHRPGKEIVAAAEMADRVKAAADARSDADFFLIARTEDRKSVV